jgi:hypothetical protein
MWASLHNLWTLGTGTFSTIQEQVAVVVQSMAEKGYQLQGQESFLWTGRKLDFSRESR